MPSAQRVDDALSLDELLARIERLYRELEALPKHQHPETSRPRRRQPSLAYQTIEAEIREYARLVWALHRGD